MGPTERRCQWDLYLYGGHSISTAGQSQNTWSNDFLSVALAEGWDISAPKLTGLPQPSGPPAVANGYLWNSYDSLYLFGGIVSDSPPETPDPYSLWEYDIKASAWKQHKNPTTSAGNNSDKGNQPIQQAGEGAGTSVPGLGRGWYFGGHLDHYTTPGWSIQVARQYLKSLVEFTFPGYTNDGVESLRSGNPAGDDGVWRNVTQGGIQDTNSFTYRADGVLVYVPGYGTSGILLSLAGGTNVSFVSSSFWVGLAAWLIRCVGRLRWMSLTSMTLPVHPGTSNRQVETTLVFVSIRAPWQLPLQMAQAQMFICMAVKISYHMGSRPNMTTCGYWPSPVSPGSKWTRKANRFLLQEWDIVAQCGMGKSSLSVATQDKI